MDIQKSALTVAVLGSLILGAEAAQAAQVAAVAPIYDNSSNFTVLGPNGDMYMGANDVVFNWDGSIFTATSDYTGPGSASNATLSSATPFFSFSWTAHDIQVFGPGTYAFDTTLGGGTEFGMLAMNVGSRSDRHASAMGLERQRQHGYRAGSGNERDLWLRQSFFREPR